jgi:hypothetical protein
MTKELSKLIEERDSLRKLLDQATGTGNDQLLKLHTERIEEINFKIEYLKTKEHPVPFAFPKI